MRSSTTLISTSKKYLLLLAPFIIWLGLLLFTTTRLPYDYDSVNFALAYEKSFNPAIHQPQPPGYLFHVMFGKSLSLFSGNPFLVQRVQNIIYLSVWLVFLILLQPSPLLLFLLLTSPLILTFAMLPIHYAVSAAFAGILCYQFNKLSEKKLHIITFSATYFIAIGFRQDLLLFLGPIFLFGVYRIKPKIKELAMIGLLFIIIYASWYIPTLMTAKMSPSAMSAEVLNTFASASSIFYGASLKEHLRWALRFLLFGIAAFGPATLLFFILHLKYNRSKDLFVIALGTLPCIMFGLLIHGPKPGYYAPALGFIITHFLYQQKSRLSPVLLTSLILTNVFFLFYFPSPHWKKGEGFENRTINKNVKKQISYIGACGFKEQQRRVNTIKFVHAKLKDCECFYAREKSPENRLYQYCAEFLWKNKFSKVPDSSCYSVGDLRTGTMSAYKFNDVGIWTPLKTK